jgi:hypothetical protein
LFKTKADQIETPIVQNKVTPEYTHSFKKWSPELGPVLGNQVYTAVYDTDNPTLNSYTITWMNWNGEVLKTDENVPYGTTPSYTGETPRRDNEAGVVYTFDHWTPNVVPVEGNDSYTAVYNSEIFYHVTVVPRSGMMKTSGSGAEEQDVHENSEINTVIYTADNDHYFPAAYYVEPVNGISVTRDSDKQVSVSGTPNANTRIILGDPALISENTVSDPILSIEEGSYVGPQSVVIQSDTDGAEIWYTTDGSDPSDPNNPNRKKYADEILITENTTITVVAVKDEMYPSRVITVNITIEEEPEPMELNVVIHHITGTGEKGIPGDINQGTMPMTIIIKSGDDELTRAVVEMDYKDGDQKIELTALFNKIITDLAPGVQTVEIKGLPSEITGIEPLLKKYKLTWKAWINNEGGITIDIIWDDGSVVKTETLVVYALPEDEVGAYALLKDGTKEYLIFHTYDICMKYLGEDELCRGYEHCYHKVPPYEINWMK